MASCLDKLELKAFLKQGALMSLEEGRVVIGLLDLEADFDKNPLQKDYFINPGFLLSDLEQKIYLETKIIKDKGTWVQIIENEIQALDLAPLKWESDDQAYLESYAKAQERIASGQIKKIVPFKTFKAKKPKNFLSEYLFSILKNLSLKGGCEYLYGFWSAENGFVGSTPELLLMKEKASDQILTMALAGTLDSNSPTNMLKDKKLMDEHQIVIDDINNKLKNQNKKNKIIWGNSYEKQYNQLKHIKTDGVIQTDLNLFELIKKLSPTSALGAYPSSENENNKDILRPEQRGAYGAPFVWSSEDEYQVIVCLRGLFWDNEYLYIHVGGGVTASSLLVDELKELDLKFQSTKLKLGI